MKTILCIAFVLATVPLFGQSPTPPPNPDPVGIFTTATTAVPSAGQIALARQQFPRVVKAEFLGARSEFVQVYTRVMRSFQSNPSGLTEQQAFSSLPLVGCVEVIRWLTRQYAVLTNGGLNTSDPQGNPIPPPPTIVVSGTTGTITDGTNVFTTVPIITGT
jgi:hypothetical protein